MRILFFFLVLAIGFAAQAFTSGQFAGPYGIIRVIAKDYSGVADTDGQVLYRAMDVPIQDSMMGPGKVIQSSDQALQFICADRPQVGFECSIFIQPKGHGSVNILKKTMKYKVTGTEADAYVKLFKTDASGEFHFVSVDNLLRVDVRPQFFEVSFAQNPQQSSVRVFTAPAPVETLVVIHVEDTLKISHVQNFWDSLNYNKDTKKRFMGMSAALTALAQQNPSFHFVYLVQDPELVAGKIDREFVSNNGFPRGLFKTYSTNIGKEQRLKVLRSLLDQFKPQKVILLSHNGSIDPEAFHELAVERNGITFLPYIHVVYSTTSATEVGTGLYPEQTGFVTSVELMVDWQLKRLTDFTGTLNFAATMIPRMIHENTASKAEEYAIPEFVNCDDFQWRWPLEDDFKILSPLRDYLVNRCHMQVPLVGYSR